MQNNAENTANNEFHPPKKWAGAVMVALIGAFMTILDSSIVNVAIPTMMHVFNTNTCTIEWVVTIYLLSLGVVVPLSGWMGDKYGYKRLYIGSLIVFTAGSLLCTLSWNTYSLIAARVIQAMGGGMIMPTTMAMITRIVPKERFGSAMGVFGIALLVAPAIGPTLGGYLVEYVNWRWIFTINLPVGIIGILLSFFFLPEFPQSKVEKLDVGGALTSAVMLFTLLLALSEGSSWGWSSEPTIMLFYISAVAMILFVYMELTSKSPLLDLRIFRYTTFTMSNIMSIITTVGLYAGIFYVPLFLQNIRGMGAMQTGLLMMPAALISGLMMPITGRLYDKIGPRPLSVVGLLFLAYTTYLFHYIDISTPTSQIMTWLILRSVGMSFSSMSAQAASVGSVPTEMVSRASAISNIVSRVSASFGIAVLTSILNSRMSFYTMQMGNQVTMSNFGVSQLLSRLAGMFGSGQTAVMKAKVLGITYLQGMVSEAAFIRGIDDIFIIASCFALAGIIPALFLKKTDVPKENANMYE